MLSLSSHLFITVYYNRNGFEIQPFSFVFSVAFVIAATPLLVCLILTIVFGCKIPTVRDNRYIPVTIVFGALTFVAFIVFTFFANKFINANRIYRRNERLSSTEDGERLQEIRDYKALYTELLRIEEEAEEEAADVIYE